MTPKTHHGTRFINRVDDILTGTGKNEASALFGLALSAAIDEPTGSYSDLCEDLRSKSSRDIAASDLDKLLRKAPVSDTVVEDQMELWIEQVAAAFRAASIAAGLSARTLEERLFQPMEFNNGWCISAQGDQAGYACKPRDHLDFLEDYEELEIVVYAPDRDYVDPIDLGLTSSTLAKFNSYCADGPHIGANLTWAEIAELADAVRAMPTACLEMEP
ncbi:hypothetical protein KUV57_12205 [Epibacterium sp. DP7N7-1]|nr:hypothetical protein [Epibacterium sp. DP7N7-1]